MIERQTEALISEDHKMLAPFFFVSDINTGTDFQLEANIRTSAELS